MAERDIQHAVMRALGGIEGCVIWRNHTGRVQDQSGRWHSFGLGRGGADLVGIAPGGRFLAVEVKTPRGRLRPEQRMWLDLVRDHGGIAIVARSAEEALQKLAAACGPLTTRRQRGITR